MKIKHHKEVIKIPQTHKEWLLNWLDILNENGYNYVSHYCLLDALTIKKMLDIINNQLNDDYVCFNNAGETSFEIWTGKSLVKEVLKGLNQFVYFYRLNKEDIICKWLLWNKPRTYLNSFSVKKGQLSETFEWDEYLDTEGKYK